jgi:hypothetical protein
MQVKKTIRFMLVAISLLAFAAPVLAQKIGEPAPKNPTGDFNEQKKLQKEQAKKFAKAQKKQEKKNRQDQKKAAREYKKKHPTAS